MLNPAQPDHPATGAPPVDASIDSVEVRGDYLLLVWSDGRRDLLQAIWLRDNCRCPRCRHAGSGQRLFDVDALPEAPRLARVGKGPDGALVVEFSGDGHASRFTSDWLRRSTPAQRTVDTRQQTWDASLQDALPWHDHARVCAEPLALRDWLAAVERYGFALLRGVACDSGMVERIAGLFGFVRETNYGRHFDVRSRTDPINLAYTGLGLSVHTDNPYRDPAPTLQLLHCLRNEVDGGATLLVDGFHCATLLAERIPHAFALLTRHRVPFRFESADTVLEARAALIEMDDRGRLRTVRYNNRSVEAFDAPSEALPGFYRAYRAFTRLLFDRAHAVRFRLAPGDLLLLDNRRVLHGREAFDGAGERWLQGCYAEADALGSRLAVLRRETPLEEGDSR